MKLLQRMLCVGLLLLTPCSYGEDGHAPVISNTQNSTQYAESHKQELNQLLQSDKYSKSYEKTTWQRIGESQEQGVSNSWLVRFLEWLFGRDYRGMESAVGVIGKGLALLLLAMIVYFVIKNLDKFQNFSFKKLSKLSPTAIAHTKEMLIDMNAGLPERDELISQVEYWLNQGQYVKALSLLYRGTLRELLFTHALPITHSQTEEQCQAMLARAKKVHPSEMQFFKDLIGLWQMSAYGKRLPTDAKQKISTLSHDWQRIYLNESALSSQQMEMA